MKNKPVAIVFLLLLGLAPSVRADVESELRALEVTRRAAIKAKDFDTLKKIYAPGLVVIGANAEFFDRESSFGIFALPDSGLSFVTDEIKVVSEGDTAVFFARLTASDPDGEVVFATRFSHVYVRRKGAWVCIAAQSTPIPDAGS